MSRMFPRGMRIRVVVRGSGRRTATRRPNLVLFARTRLCRGHFELLALVWSSLNVEVERGWTWERAHTVTAISTLVAWQEARGDWTDDEQADVVMDSAYLQTALELDDPQNPFSCFPPPRHSSF
jgi:hypothetical protein